MLYLFIVYYIYVTTVQKINMLYKPMYNEQAMMLLHEVIKDTGHESWDASTADQDGVGCSGQDGAGRVFVSEEGIAERLAQLQSRHWCGQAVHGLDKMRSCKE